MPVAGMTGAGTVQHRLCDLVGCLVTSLAPLLERCSAFVEFTGELGGRERNALLGGAKATLFPIDWPEPFGLVMIESLACGTPVIAWKRGSVPEVIDDQRSGFVVDSVKEAVRAVGRINTIDRAACRSIFEARFDATRMARECVEVYQRL